MELWIRSQKNEELRPLLLKVNEFEIGDYDDDMNCIVVNNLHCVGVYKTKERALEVLDEIQDILHPKMIMESNGGAFVSDDNNLHIINPTYQKIEQLDTIVYEMPQE